ncbi:MAG: EamA family transporter [Solirubrobacterales bacterium]
MPGGEQAEVSMEARLVSAALVIGAGISLLLGSAIVISLFDDVGEAGAVLLRLFFAAVVLLALWRPALAGRSRRAWRYAVIFGAVVAGLNFFFFEAIDRAPLGIVSSVGFIGPLVVALAASRRPVDLVWIVMAALGIFLFTPLGGGSLDSLGLLFSGLVAAGWAGYILVASRIGQAFEGGDGLALGVAFGVLIMAPGGIASGGADLLRPEVLAVGAAVAVMSSAIPYTMELEALRRLDTGTFGILVSLQPAIAALVGFFVLSQDLRATEVLAVALVIAASIGALGRARAPAPLET